MEFFTLDNALLPGAPFDPARGTTAAYGLSETLYREWNDCVDADLYDPSCSAPAWQLSFHDTFAPARRVFIETDGRNAVAFSEGSFSDGSPCLLPLEPHWFSGCPILGPEGDQLFARCLGAIIREYGGRVPGVLLSSVFAGGELIQRLTHGFSRFYQFALYSSPEQRSASLEGGFEGWLSRRSGNFRSKIKKSLRRAEGFGVQYERHVPATHEEADAIYARMLDVESRSWKGHENSGISESPSREFYLAMMHRLTVGPQAGCARVMFATHEGQDIGFIFGSLAGGELTSRPFLIGPRGELVTAHRPSPRGSVYRGQQFSYDNEKRAWSVGDILQYKQIEWLCEEGVSRYDMGMSDDPRMAYKTHWAETVRKQQTWIMLPKQQ